MLLATLKLAVSALLVVALAWQAPKRDSAPRVQDGYEDIVELHHGGGAISSTGVQDKGGFTVVPVEAPKGSSRFVISFAVKGAELAGKPDFRVLAVDKAGKRHRAKAQPHAWAGGNGVGVVTLVPEFNVSADKIRSFVIQRRVRLAAGLGKANWAVGAGLVAIQLQASRQPQSRPARPARPPAPPALRVDRPRTDHDGEPLPAGALARIGSVRYRVNWVLGQVAFSPDGRWLAAACDGVRMFDRATGRLIWHAGKPSRAFCLAFSPDGKMLAAGGGYGDTDRLVRLLDPATGKELRRFPGNDHQIHCLAFSPNGRLLASGGFDKAVRLLDFHTGREALRLTGFMPSVCAIAFSPDGRHLAVLDGARKIHLCDAQTGQHVRQWKLDVKPAYPAGIVFARDGKTLLTGTEDGVRLWDTHSDKPGRVFAGLAAPVHSLALAPDGKIVAAGLADGGVCVADMATGKVIRRWQAYPYSLPDRANLCAVDTVAFAPDGQAIATGAIDFTRIRLWDARTGQALNSCSGPQEWIAWLAFTPDGRTLRSVGRDRLICSLDPQTAVERAHFELPGRGYVTTALSPDGRRVASRGWKEDRIRFWDADSKKELGNISASVVQSQPFMPSALAVSPDRRLVALGGEGLALYDAHTGRLLHQAASPKAVCVLAFSPDARLLAIGQDSRSRGAAGLWLWDVKASKAIRRLDPGHDVEELTFSPDGRLLAAAEGRWRQLVVWESATGKEVWRFRSDNWFVGVAFSPDGRLLAGVSAGDSSVLHVWELASGGEVRKFTDQEDAMAALAWTADGRTLASGGYGTILLWDVTGHALGRIQLPRIEKDLESCWADLESANAAQAIDAVYALGAAPTLAVPFLREHLQPARAPDPQRLAKLLADLNSPRFRTREQATAELRRAGDGIELDLRKRLSETSSPEARRRLQQVLDSLTHGADQLRMVRAVEVLEDIATPAARALLHQLASGSASAGRTQEAKAALARLARR